MAPEGTTCVAGRGDSVTSIAEAHGFFWQTIWDHAQNSELKSRRRTPNVIAEGDEVFVPPLTQKQEARATEACHTFKRKGVPAVLRLQLLEMDEPRAGEDYILEIDGSLTTGTTDAEGRIEQPISPKARGGTLTLKKTGEIWPIRIGHLDPVDTPTGVQQRLNNLAFDCGAEDGDLGRPECITALKSFQAKHGLPVSGQADAATAAKLEEVHQ